MHDSMMKISNLMNWDNIPFEKLDDGALRQMVVGENLMICRITFPPNVTAIAHDHPHEQMTIVEKGRARFILGDGEREVGPGDVIHIKPNLWHGATMLDEEVILIDIFSPIREDFLTK
jgi:quercetin dioxygenase-like cupin family protein